jgi:hypothetical protein
MPRKVAKQQKWPTPTRKMACPVCENMILVNLGMLITEALQKFGPLTQEELERITAYMAHFRFCLGSEYEHK